MPTPSLQRYIAQGKREGIDETVLQNARAAIERIRAADARMVPVLSLRHLAHLSDVPFIHLRKLVGRRVPHAYRSFKLRKRVPGRTAHRTISVPSPSLLLVQRWIVRNILRHTTPHDASYAFHPECRPYEAAEVHCGCSWLLKVDLQDFFHSVSEGRVAAVFEHLGYAKLLSFELARLVTSADATFSKHSKSNDRWAAIPYYTHPLEGFLPQGAPTSPMLSNLIMLKTDEALEALALEHGMKYTRYADDLAFSGGAEHNFSSVMRLKRAVLRVLTRAGFHPNLRKTVIRGPGSRRIVLGMLVDGESPRLPREYKDMIRLHLHYLTSLDFGPSRHAEARKTSVSGIFHHVRGLIGWAQIVEPEFGRDALTQFESVDWPPIQLSI